MSNHFIEYMNALSPVEAKAFLRKVMGPPTRQIDGQEKEHLLLMLALIKPFKETNNQHSWTAYYMIGDKEYHATYWPGEDIPAIDELLKEEE